MAFLTNNGYNFSVSFEIGRYKRQSSVYDSIAQATGGDVERFSSSADLADKVQEDLMVILFSFFLLLKIISIDYVIIMKFRMKLKFQVHYLNEFYLLLG